MVKIIQKDFIHVIQIEIPVFQKMWDSDKNKHDTVNI